MFCTECGAKINDSAKFCNQCGSKLVGKDNSNSMNMRPTSRSATLGYTYAKHITSSFDNYFNITGMSTLKYIVIMAGFAILVLLWLWAPIIELEAKGFYKLTLLFKEGLNIGNTDITFFRLVHIMFSYLISRGRDGNYADIIMVFFSICIIVAAVFFIWYVFKTVMCLVKRQPRALEVYASNFVFAGLIILILMFAFVGAYNMEVKAEFGKLYMCYQLRFNLIGYVMAVLAILYKLLIVNMPNINSSKPMYVTTPEVNVVDWTCSRCGRENNKSQSACQCGKRRYT